MSREKVYVYHTDEHFKRANPVNRLDVFHEAIAGKIDWITDYGEEIGADGYILGGDLFDKPRQSAWEIWRMFQLLNRRSVPSYALAGNHPILGDPEEWVESSGLYLIQAMLTEKFQILDAFKADLNLGNGVKARLHHTDLVKRRVPWKHTLWEDYDAGDCDLVLVSHYHPQQGIWTRDDGVTFVSPGAVSRGTLGEDNVNRKPAIAVIRLQGEDIDIELVDIPCAPGVEVLDAEHTMTVESIQKTHENFQESVDTIVGVLDKEIEVVDPTTIIKTTATELGVRDAVVDRCLELLQERRK